jgi:hypothetical protein
LTVYHRQSVEQLSLELFPPSSFESLLQTENIRHLSVTFSNRLKKNWYIKIYRHDNTRELFLPVCLKTSPDSLKKHIIEWALLPARTRRSKRSVNNRKCHLEHLIRSYIEQHAPVRGSTPPPSQKWPTQGVRYDLQEVFTCVNKQYFSSRLQAFLRWGKEKSRTSYQSTRKDDSGNPWHLITIAGVYNHEDVPRYAIEAIMFHEMLHIHIPPRRINGRNVIHGPDFKKEEHSFPHYDRWIVWERDILPTLHRMKKRKRFPLFRFG